MLTYLANVKSQPLFCSTNSKIDLLIAYAISTGTYHRTYFLDTYELTHQLFTGLVTV